MASVRCSRCGRPEAICVCDVIRPLACATTVLVLQHPRESDEVLGTAQLLWTSLESCRVRAGMSWPNLANAWGRTPTGRWAVLWNHHLPGGVEVSSLPAPVSSLDASGRLLPPGGLEGVIVLDGTWQKAKTLWWRNPWLLKLERIVLQPTEASIYGRVRKEPQRFAVSTLEAVADALVHNGEPAETRTALRRLMRTMVQRARDSDPRADAGGLPFRHNPDASRHEGEAAATGGDGDGHDS